MLRAAGLVISGALLAGAPAALAAPARDWTRTVVQTPEGGFLMGNPAAKVKLVEYGSLTCPHCASFSAASKAGIAARVRSGRMSFEFRNLVLNGVDLAATLLARCGGTTGFFRLTEAFYAAQPRWIGRFSGLTDAQKAALQALPGSQQPARVAQLGGLTELAAASGLPQARANACLADEAAVQRIGRMVQAASALGIQGTPSFLVNGRRVQAGSWSELEPIIAKAGG